MIALALLLAGAGPAAAQSFPPSGLAKPSPHTMAGTAATDRGTLAVPYARYVADEVLVRFGASAGGAGRSAALAAVGAKVDRVLPLPGLRTVKLPAGVSVDEAVRRFEADPRVEYAEPNYRLRNNGAPNDPDFYKQWGVHNTGQPFKGFVGTADADIDAPEAWDMTRGDQGVVVGHIDGGVAPNHSDLGQNLWTNADEIANNGVDDDGNGYVDDRQGWDWTSHENTSTNCAVGDKDPSDNNGHGTHTAGTIGAYGDNGTGVTGVAQRVSLMPLRATGQNGTGTLEDIICAFRYAVANGAEVINASIGDNFESQALLDIVQGAPNVLVVTTAGNKAQDVDVVRHWPCNMPASNVLCVAATDAKDNLWLDTADFWAARPGAGSNYGDTNVDMAAPGMLIHSTSPFRSVLRDNFDNYDFGGRWTTGAANNRFGIEYPTSGPRDVFALSDSTRGNYDNDSNPNDSDPWAQAPRSNTVGMRDCQVHYRIVDIDTEPAAPDPDGEEGPLTGAFDYLATELSSGGGQWSAPIGFHYSPDSKPGVRALLAGPAFDNKSEFWLRYRFHSDGSVVGDGAHIDDLDVKCTPDNKSYDATSYAVDSGTSMAAPHVTGTVALMLTVKPDLTPYQLKQILMDSGDYKASLDGKTVSGRRLNAANAVASVLPPNTEFSRMPASTTGSSTAVFKFTSTQSLTEPDSGFECMLDQRDFWHDCTAGASRTYNDLTGGTYTFRVRAINRAGVKDPTPASYTWTVDKTGPETYLSPALPANPTGYTRARFDFGTDVEEQNASFECKLDSGAWETCNSGSKAYPASASGTPLAVGAHTFQVLARDQYGNPDPTPSSYAWTIATPPSERNPVLDGWSASASARGDFDGDGYDDLAIGVPGEDAGTVADAGAVHVLYGTTTGLSASRSQFLTQNTTNIADTAEPGDGFGAALAVGDLDGDGRSDLIVGAPGEDGSAGTVHVLRGSSTGVATIGSQQWRQSTATPAEPVEAGDRFGATLAAGDTTGDGKAELLIGAPGEDVGSAGDAGAVQFLPGSASGPAASGSKLITQAPADVADAPEAGDELGAALALGDFNGDGKADLALAAPGEAVGTFAQAGAVHVLAGAAGGYTTTGSKLFHQDTAYVTGDAEPGDRFGAALAAGGFGGSSADELAIGVPGEDLAGTDNGAVQVLMGATPGLLTTTNNKLWNEDTPYVLDTADPGDQFGASLAAGNFGGSPEDELAIGVPGEDAAFALDSGMVTVLAGATNGLVTAGNRLWTQATPYVGEDAEPGDHFGAALAAGDFGDSAEDDLVVGVPDESVGGVEGAGAVLRQPGSSTGLKALDGQLLSQATYAVADAPEAGDGFGAGLGR